MKILLIGASSYVGARIYFDLKDKFEIIGTYNSNPLSKSFIKLDITEKANVLDLFNKTKPDVIVHVANYPSSRNAVNNEENFIKLNDEGTIHIVTSANEIGARMVFISSQAANNPNDTIYGELKAKSEELVTTTRAGYLILRPSYIVGFSPNTTNPRPFNKILQCLDGRSDNGVFDTPWKLQPSYVGHLSQVIEKAIKNEIWNKTIPVFIDELVTQYQIAQDILSKFHITVSPVDQHIHILPSTDNLDEFNAFHLPPYTYKEMIELIISEIKGRDKFKLQ